MKEIKIKIILSILAIFVIVLGTIYIYKKNNNNDSINQISIIIYDKDDTILFNDVYETKVIYLIELLDEFYTVEVKDGFLYKIGKEDIYLEAYDNKKEYIMIMVNSNYSTKGVNTLKLKNEMNIEFKIKKV